MKLSLKIRDEQQHQQQQYKTPLLKAKVPLIVVGVPFISGIIAGDPSDLSFNLSTNFLTGPSLKLSYTPNITAAAAAVTPFTLSLKSGIGLFGSPRDSPLVISAHFNLFSTNNTPNFSLQIKPQFGNFSLHKSTFSNPNPIPKLNLGSDLNGGSGLDGGYRTGFLPERSMEWTNVTLESCSEKGGITSPNGKENGGIGIGFGPERPLVWRDLTMESCNGKDGILSGVKVRARTALPVTSQFVANFRWGLNFPAEMGRKLPFLTVDKIGIERVEEVKVVKKDKKSTESDVGDTELLKGMCNWMRSDLEVLQKENWELKQSLEKLKLGVPARNYGVVANGKVENNKLPPVENSGGFEQWRSKKSGGDDNSRKELRKPADHAADVESELQKAIKAASSQ